MSDEPCPNCLSFGGNRGCDVCRPLCDGDSVRIVPKKSMGKTKKNYPTEIDGSAVISRQELIVRWERPPRSIQFFLRLEKAGKLTPFKPIGIERGGRGAKVVYRLDDVLQLEQESVMIIRQANVNRIANHIRTISRPSVEEWLGLYYAMWHVLSRISPVEQRACINHVIDTVNSTKP